MNARLPAVFLALAVTAGCAQSGSFPSLAPRPVERLSFEEPVRVDPPVAADPALAGRAAGLLGQARNGDGAFEAAYARAVPLARSAGPPASDSWLQAQEAISRAEAARVATTSALAELDRLLIERADVPTNDEVYAEIRAAREAAERIVQNQQARIALLRRSVSQP